MAAVTFAVPGSLDQPTGGYKYDRRVIAGLRQRGCEVDVIDLGFGVLTVPVGSAGQLLDQVLPANDHYAAVAAEDDPDLVSR